MIETVATIGGGMFEGLDDGLSRRLVKDTDGTPSGWYMGSPDSTECYPARLIDGELVAFGAPRGAFVVRENKVYRERPTPRVVGQQPTPQPPTLAEEGWVAPTPHSQECCYTDTTKAPALAEKVRAACTGDGPRTKADAIYWFCGCGPRYLRAMAVAALVSDLPDAGYDY